MIRAPRLLHDALLRAQSDPDWAQRKAVIVEGRAHRYGELLDASLRLASALVERGLERGDRVAIFMENSWPCVVSIYATWFAGGVVMVLNPQTKADKLAFVLEDSGARVLLSESHLAREMLPAFSKLEAGIRIICTGEIEAAFPIESLDEILRTTLPLEGPRPTIPLDLAALIYTSGSTGQPKGVMQTHQSMVFATGSLIEYLRLGPDERILSVLPLAFDYGLYQLLMAISLGATLVLERGFTYPAEIVKRVKEQEITVFPGVPTIFSMLVSMHNQRPLSFESVARVTNTAASLPEHFNTRLREIFPRALVYRMYGLTECKRVSYLEPEMIDKKPGSVGKAIPGTEVVLLDSDGRPSKPGEVGVLHVRGPHVMLGYWKRPEETAKMLRPGPLPYERILCTHDHFRMDDEGYLYFVGRSDDIIKTRGEKVSPAEVENVLYSIEGVREAAVIGMADELLGQAIRAYVVLEPGVDLTAQKLRALAAARLESFMVPKEFVFCSELPRTATGKISHRSLSNMNEAKLAGSKEARFSSRKASP